MAAAGGIPPTIMPAIRVPERAMTAPTERSIPPVRIAQVMPMAMMALIETCRAMFMKLSAERKLSVVMIMTRLTAKKPTSGKA